MSVYVIGDVHGCYKTLLALLNKIPSDAQIVFAGDLVDRGAHSAKVVRLVRERGYQCVKGNHEELAHSEDPETLDYWYRSCGGAQTSLSYDAESLSFDEDREWFRKLPTYIEFTDVLDKKGRKLLVSHTTIANYWLKNDLDNSGVLWTRAAFPPSIPGYYNVYGHTPIRKPLIKEHFANIDTGCVYGKEAYLTALKFPEMEVIQQQNIEDEEFLGDNWLPKEE